MPHLRLALFCTLAMAIPAGPPALAAPVEGGWVRVRADGFEVLSDAGEAHTRQAAAALEQFGRVLARVLPPRARGPEAPVVVLAFRDSGSFEPFLPRHQDEPRQADGFFQGGTARSYIAVNLGSARSDRYDPLYHEYAHLALNQALPAQPAWVSEGLADLYSAWQAMGTQATVGVARPEHLRVLRRQGLVPLEALLRADYTSDLYNKPGRRDVFYAQSWAFAHYLLLGRPDGRTQLEQYLLGITQGLDPAVSFRAAFAEDLEAVQAKLEAYLAAPTLPSARLSVEDLTADGTSASSAPAAAEVDYALGDLLLHEGRSRDARRHLERALQADPAFVPAREALAQVALGQARWEEARAHLRTALEREPDSPLALYRYADALVREASSRNEVLSEEDTGAAVTALEKCVARAPHFAEAVHLLARLKPSPVHHRIALVEAAFDREPQRTEMGITLAGLYARANDRGRAAATLLRAREAARDDDMRFLCGHLLRRFGYTAALTSEARGMLVGLECLPDGGLNFLVEAEGARLRLYAPSPSAAMLYGPDGEAFEKELVCGSHRARVLAWYRRPSAGGPAHADGELLSLSFPEEPPP